MPNECHCYHVCYNFSFFLLSSITPLPLSVVAKELSYSKTKGNAKNHAIQISNILVQFLDSSQSTATVCAVITSLLLARGIRSLQCKGNGKYFKFL